MGNKYTCKQTFEEWCLSNNRQDILDLWDYDRNDVLPSEIPFGTKKRYYFKCHNGIHESETKRILTITERTDHRIICKQCESEGLYKMDLTGKVFGELTVLQKDEEKSSRKLYYWICKCSCGEILSVDQNKLRNGEKTACGVDGEHKLIKLFNEQEIRHSSEYYKYRDAVIAKDNGKCIITGKEAINPEVHHIYPFALYPHDRLDVDCGVCISREYHSTNCPGSFHNVYGTQNNTPEQFQDYVNMKRKELGIEEYFDVYEYMNSYDADCLEIDDLDIYE